MTQRHWKRLVIGSCLLVLLAQTGLYSAEIETSGEQKPYASYVEQCMDILMEHGTDRYGDVHAPVLVTILDVQSRTCPEVPKTLDEQFPVTRRDRRSPAGSNLLTDQPTLKAMYALSAITGNKDYAAFADRYCGHVMKNLVDEQRKKGARNLFYQKHPKRFLTPLCMSVFSFASQE